MPRAWSGSKSCQRALPSASTAVSISSVVEEKSLPALFAVAFALTLLAEVALLVGPSIAAIVEAEPIMPENSVILATSSSGLSTTCFDARCLFLIIATRAAVFSAFRPHDLLAKPATIPCLPQSHQFHRSGMSSLLLSIAPQSTTNRRAPTL